MLLNGNTLMMDDVKHLSMCLLCMLPSAYCLFRPFIYFMALSLCMLNCNNSLYSLDIRSLTGYVICKYFHVFCNYFILLCPCK